MMLPIDLIPDAVGKLLCEHQVSMETLLAALRLDLTPQGEFGEQFLLLSEHAETIYRADATKGTVETFDTSLLRDPYLDHFTTTNRLLALKKPSDPSESTADSTVILGCCTNACKMKLNAFVSIWERVQAGKTVLEDDPIFDQFHAKCPKCGTVYPDQHRRVCEHCTNKKGLLIRLLAYFKDFKPQLACVLLCLFASSAISLLNPIISGQILFDQVISAPTYNDAGVQITGKMHELKYVYIMIGVIVGMALVSLLISILQNRANAHMSTHVVRNMRNDIFRAMSKLSLSFFNQNQTGRLINRVNYDAAKIRSFYIDGVPHLIVHVLNFIGLTAFLFSINWKLTLIVFIPVPIIVAIFRIMLPKLWRAFTKQWRASSSFNAMLGDSLSGVRVVKAFAKEADEGARFFRYSRRLTKANLKANVISIMIFPVVSLLVGMSSQAIWGFGGIEVMGERMTYGELTTYIGYTGMIFGPLNFFSTFTNLITDTINAASRMFETLDMIPEISDSKHPVHLEAVSGDIEFRNVCFHYSPNKPILKDVSFTIKAGEHIGLVGHTGSGKSTIANLITRMYDTVSGSIYIDGTNVKDIEIMSLRRNVAVVSQEIYLFAGTIADNIRYAKPEATMDEVIAAARAANAHDFIMSLPEGYESCIGIGHRSLSGGERQRISIARALLLKPSLLILDEATAAMDTETERLISDAVDQLIEGRTTITIAHRLSTLKNCDRLMAIEHGRIAEEGTAEELLQKKGVYYKLWTLQTEQMKKVAEGI